MGEDDNDGLLEPLLDNAEEVEADAQAVVLTLELGQGVAVAPPLAVAQALVDSVARALGDVELHMVGVRDVHALEDAHADAEGDRDADTVAEPDLLPIALAQAVGLVLRDTVVDGDGVVERADVGDTLVESGAGVHADEQPLWLEAADLLGDDEAEPVRHEEVEDEGEGVVLPERLLVTLADVDPDVDNERTDVPL